MNPDLLWDTWCQFRYNRIDPVLTKSERGRINKALKELREVAATSEQLQQRIMTYRKRWPQIDCTITAIAANWMLLAAEQRKYPTQMDDSELMRYCRENHVTTLGKTRKQILEAIS